MRPIFFHSLVKEIDCCLSPVSPGQHHQSIWHFVIAFVLLVREFTKPSFKKANKLLKMIIKKKRCILLLNREQDKNKKIA